MTSLPSDARKSAVVELVSRHKDGLRFGADLKKTEIQFSDDYLLLAAHLILSDSDGVASPLTDRVFQVCFLRLNSCFLGSGLKGAMFFRMQGIFVLFHLLYYRHSNLFP